MGNKMNGLYAHAPCYLPIARVIMYLSYILKPYKEKKKKKKKGDNISVTN